MEGIFKSDGVALLTSFNTNNKCSDDRFVGSPSVRDESGGIEKSWSDDIGFEVFLNSSLFHVPSNDFEITVSIISDFDLMESIVVPVITLIDITIVEVIVNIVVVSEVIGWINPGF
eukprot:TRINITY_DN2567_c0_g1_i1.p1 TRINITY_DN2567_c0_g1~~TRINITY_DN2567_c0_g1_i1.p1  ORF type:complete len:116 (-),score=11.96 TRINITY_DN2567_c0_g1_i1:2-349(-)